MKNLDNESDDEDEDDGPHGVIQKDAKGENQSLNRNQKQDEGITNRALKDERGFKSTDKFEIQPRNSTFNGRGTQNLEDEI